MNYGKMLKSLIWKRYTDEFYIKPGKRAGNLSAYNQWLNDDSDLDFASAYKSMKVIVVLVFIACIGLITLVASI